MDMNTNTNSNNYAQNGKVLLGSAILLFFMLIFLFFLHSYSCPCFHRRQRRHRRNQHLFPMSTTEPHTALDPSLFKLLPTFKYSSATLQECAVCLSEFKQNDGARLLPNCNHCFHTHCIDKWFRSHSTCPLCRALVQPSEISPAKTVAVVSDGEFAGCSYLPPPMSCPRKGLDLDLDMVRVIVEGMSENVRNSAGDVGLKSPGDGPGEWGPARPK